jgi:hypothetical protein
MKLLQLRKTPLIVLLTVALGLLMVSVYFVTQYNPSQQTDIREVDLVKESQDAQREKIADDLINASTPEEKLSAFASSATLALNEGNEEEAVAFALEAYAVDELGPIYRFSKAMNLVDVYGRVGEFTSGLEILDEISQDTEAMSLEASDFYVSRYRLAFEKNQVPGPVNCQDPQGPEDCPVQ